jgi:hypothetical protein
MPNPVAGDSGLDAGKSKKRDGFMKPKSEPAPNRTCETEIGGASMSGVHVSLITQRALKAWVRMLGNPKAIFVRHSD